jgi:hypothetical protein
MISSLEDLVAPLTEAEYLEILRAGKPTLRRGLAANRFTPLLDWATLWKVIESDVVPLKKSLVTRKGHDVPAIFYRDQGKLNAAKLASLIPHGISLIATSVDAHVPTLQALCANIQARIGKKINVTAVMTIIAITGRSFRFTCQCYSNLPLRRTARRHYSKAPWSRCDRNS